GQRDRRHASDGSQAIGHDLDRLFGRGMAEHCSVAVIEGPAQPREALPIQRALASDGDLIALPGIAHIEAALDADVALRKTLVAQVANGVALQLCKDLLD